MTPTEIITKSRDLLCKQGKPAISELGGCSYRTSDNLACAVGILLSDEDAALMDMMGEGSIDYILQFNLSKEEFENHPDREYLDETDWDTYQKVSPEARKMMESNPELMQSMQVIHDQCQGVEPDVPVDMFVEHITEQFGYLLDAES